MVTDGLYDRGVVQMMRYLQEDFCTFNRYNVDFTPLGWCNSNRKLRKLSLEQGRIGDARVLCLPRAAAARVHARR